MRQALRTALLLTLSSCLAHADEPTRRPLAFSGDVVIDRPTMWADRHVQISGNLILKPGGTLTLDGTTVELMNTYCREFKVDWQGGTLISRSSTLGGTMRDGTVLQSNLELAKGEWYAWDTTVRYCYGIACSGKLRATRLVAGPWPDSVIMGVGGDAVVRDSNYSFALNADCSKQAGTYRFDLPSGTPVTQVYDARNIPGAAYRLELANTSVVYWFLFAGGVTMDGPPIELVLGNCPSLIPAITGSNLTGTVRLPSPWPAGDLASVITVGNLTWRAADPSVYIGTWGFYVWGKDTDLTIAGKSLLCELMVWGGKVRLVGDEGTYNAGATGTTVECYDFYGEPGEITLENATLGPVGGGGQLLGQFTAHDGGRITMRHVKLKDALLLTQGSGTMALEDVTEEGKVEVREEGGKVTRLP